MAPDPANGLFAGFVTGLTFALLLLLSKAMFFYADTGYPDFNRVEEAGRRSRRPARPARIVSINAISRSTEGPNSQRRA